MCDLLGNGHPEVAHVQLSLKVLEIIEAEDDVMAIEAACYSLAPGTRGTTLTDRRLEAARATNYDQDHFRRKIEPKIVRQGAWQLHQDAQNYFRGGTSSRLGWRRPEIRR